MRGKSFHICMDDTHSIECPLLDSRHCYMHSPPLLRRTIQPWTLKAVVTTLMIKDWRYKTLRNWQRSRSRRDRLKAKIGRDAHEIRPKPCELSSVARLTLDWTEEETEVPTPASLYKYLIVGLASIETTETDTTMNKTYPVNIRQGWPVGIHVPEQIDNSNKCLRDYFFYLLLTNMK